MNIFELLQRPELQTNVGRQKVTTGTVIGTDGTRTKINSGGIMYLADTTIPGLKAGDRVYFVAGWGAPRIIGLLGPGGNP